MLLSTDLGTSLHTSASRWMEPAGNAAGWLFLAAVWSSIAFLVYVAGVSLAGRVLLEEPRDTVVMPTAEIVVTR